MKRTIKCQVSIPLVLCVSLLSGCTIALGGTGAAIGYSRQPDSEDEASPKRHRGSDGTLQTPPKPWSVGTHLAVGVVTGLIIDAIVVGLIISDIDFPCIDCAD